MPFHFQKDFFRFSRRDQLYGDFRLILKDQLIFDSFLPTSLTVRRSYELYWPCDSAEIGANMSTLIVFSRQLCPVVGTTYNRSESPCSTVKRSQISFPCVCLFLFDRRESAVKLPNGVLISLSAPFLTPGSRTISFWEAFVVINADQTSKQRLSCTIL